MSSRADDELFSTALALPTSERARLAHQLLRSLELPESEQSDQEWQDELERRVEEVVGGSTELRDWPEAYAELKTRWLKR